MRLRKLLLTTGAIVAAGAMALAPAAQASSPTGGPIAATAVNGSTATADSTIALTMKSTSVQIALYGITTTINCTAGSAGGVVHAGTGKNSFTLTSMSMTCPSVFPGTSLAFNLASGCTVEVPFADNNVHNGFVVGTDTIDTGTSAKVSNVDGALQATNAGSGVHCVVVTISNGCTFRVGGSATAAFNETAKSTNTQDLLLSGSGLQIKSPVGCLGMYSSNQAITLTADFNVYTAAGLIDFQK